MTHRTHKLTLQTLEDRTVPAGGVLDPSFGQEGIVRFQYPDSYNSDVQDLVIQPDGKIITVGFSDAQSYFPAISRFNPDGSPDINFGHNGNVILETLPTGYGRFYAATMQPDGKIVAVGTARDEGDYEIMAVRFNSNGSLDQSFGTKGITLINILDTSENYPADDNGFSVAFAPNGKIVVGGSIFGGPYNDYMVMRLTKNGDLDTTFSQDGIANLSFGYGYSAVNDIAVLANDKIVIGGGDINNGEEGFFLARFNENGDLDTSFCADGLVSVMPPDSGNGVMRHFTLLPDGKILGSGSTAQAFSPGMGQPTLARFNSDGSLDTSFGSDGWVILPVYEGGGEFLNVTIDQDEKIIAVGFIIIPGGSFSTVAAYNADGTLDTTFGNADNQWVPGVVQTDFVYGTLDQFRSVTISSDNSIVATGLSGGLISLARYRDPNPLPDASPIEILGDGLKITTGYGSDFVRITQRSARSIYVEIKTPTKIYRRTIRLSEEFTQFSSIEVDLGGGSDRLLTVNVRVPMTIHGGSGNDYLQGGFGADTIYGEGGSDTIFGKKGDDQIDAGDGDNVVSGGNGNDLLVAGYGFNVINGGSGHDSITAGDGGNVLTGGTGFDTITSGNGNDWIKGGNGNDILFGGGGTDLIEGGYGRDFLIGGLGVDTLLGGWGSDILVGGEANLVNPANDSFASILTLWNPLNSESYATMQALFTINDDADTDTMRGRQGIDWFFGSNEIFLSDISGIENWN
jgi:uncharacterized delta-60 repeat protein